VWQSRWHHTYNPGLHKEYLTSHLDAVERSTRLLHIRLLAKPISSCRFDKPPSDMRCDTFHSPLPSQDYPQLHIY
jgi:hypothetical protein